MTANSLPTSASESDRQSVAQKLLIELLSLVLSVLKLNLLVAESSSRYQFAFPVRWLDSPFLV